MSALKEMRVTEEMIRAAAASIRIEEITSEGIAAPAYGNGISETVRSFLKNKDEVRAEINESLSILV